MQLPQELVDRVIDFLHNDRPALKASCLVHTDWIDPCRCQLFGSVTLNGLMDLESWAETFPSVLQSPAHHTRKLTLIGLCASLGDKGLNPDKLDDSLLQHLRSFNQLRKLVFTALNLHPRNSPELHFLHVRSSLTSLVFHSPYPTTQKKLLHFICSFPHLENLSITGVSRWLEDGKEGYSVPQASPPFRGMLKLAGFSDPGGKFSSRLVDLPNNVRFRLLKLDFLRAEECKSAERLIISCAATLEGLQLGSSFAGCTSLGAEFFNLGHLVALHELELTVGTLRQLSCNWVKALLSSINFPGMTLITVRITCALPFTKASQFKSNDWDLIDVVLANHFDRGLAIKVVTHVSYQLNTPACCEAVELVGSMLPRLKERDLVIVEVGGVLTRRSHEIDED